MEAPVGRRFEGHAHDASDMARTPEDIASEIAKTHWSEKVNTVM